jgi:hypothetical protein
LARHLSDSALFEFCHSACEVPVGNVDIGVVIDETTVSRAENSRRNGAGGELVIGPLRLLWVITKEGDGNIVAIENDDTTFKFGNDCTCAVKAYLTGTAKMFGNCSYIFPIEIEVAEPTILAITHNEKRLVVADVER